MTAAIALSLADQVERLVTLGIVESAGLDTDALRAAAEHASKQLVAEYDRMDSAAEQNPSNDDSSNDVILALHPERLSATALLPLVEHGGKPGFVVSDMTDVDDFTPIDVATPPDCAAYLLANVERGDEYANWSPDEAYPVLADARRTPLLLTEGAYWLLQQPAALERGRCFMTIGSRLRRHNGTLDARTPALWISNGTGRDGAERRNAPKAGWCWAGNRHTWLGIASARMRIPLDL